MKEKVRKTKRMEILETVEQLLALANRYYPDDQIEFYANGGKTGGDTLGLFVFQELSDTFDSSLKTAEKLHSGMEYLTRASAELSEVVNGFTDCLVDAVLCDFLRHCLGSKKSITLGQLDAWSKVVDYNFKLEDYLGLVKTKFVGEILKHRAPGGGEPLDHCEAEEELAKLEAGLKVELESQEETPEPE